MGRQSELGLDDVFSFGKHEGDQVEDVIEDDPGYIAWLVTSETAGFDEESCELITKKGIV